MTYPMHRAGRQARRDEHRRRIYAAAATQAALAGVSVMCSYGNHAPDGCQNDGTGCLCECHDPTTEAKP